MRFLFTGTRSCPAFLVRSVAAIGPFGQIITFLGRLQKRGAAQDLHGKSPHGNHTPLIEIPRIELGIPPYQSGVVTIILYLSRRLHREDVLAGEAQPVDVNCYVIPISQEAREYSAVRRHHDLYFGADPKDVHILSRS